jgi:hypothetical protein
MKALSVIELANLYGMTRQAVYKQVNKGNLTKKADGKIDFAEAIRVFGEPSQRVNGSQTTNTSKLSEVHLLEQQVHILQKQLELAQDREQFQREELKAKNEQLNAKDEQIESLQRLLSAPEPEPTAEQPQKLTPELIQQTATPESKPIEEKKQPEPKRRGLFGRVIHAILD